MKKITILASFLLLFFIIACDRKPNKDENNATTSDNSHKNERILVVATNAFFEPYEYYENGKIIGIDIDIANAIADKLGMKLQVNDMDFDAIIPAVHSGKASIGMAGLTINAERKMNVNFTRTYTNSMQAAIVQENSKIESIDDLQNGKIGVQQGTTGDIYCSEAYGDKNVVRYNSPTDALVALLTGKIDAVVIDSETAKALVSTNSTLKILKGAFATEEYAICVAKNNLELLEEIDNALGELIEDGTLQKIFDKYLSRNKDQTLNN